MASISSSLTHLDKQPDKQSDSNDAEEEEVNDPSGSRELPDHGESAIPDDKVSRSVVLLYSS